MCCFSLLRLVEPALALRFPQSCCVFCSVNYILQYFFSSPSMFNWPPYQSLFMRYEIEKGLRASRTSLIVRFSWGTKLKRDWERSNWERFSCQMPMSVWCGVLCLKSLSKWTDIQPVKNPEIITKITIFRSRYEILMWGCIGDHQGQLRLHSQEEGWVASIWFKLNFSNVEIQVSAAADNKGFVVNTRGWSCPTSPSRPPFSSPDGQPWNVEGASLRYTTKTVGLACFLTFLTTASRT